MKHLIFISMLLAIYLLSSCTDEEVDATNPTVSNVTLNDLSTDIQVNPGTTLHFDAVFSDDERLGQYKVNIHDNFDGHSHGGRLSASAWDTTFVVDLIGKTQTVHQDIDIPTDAATGPYHFNLQYFDAVGNEGNLFTIEFEIVDPAQQPSIIVSSPDPNVELETSAGSSFTLNAIVSDPDGLVELQVEIIEAHEDHPEHGRLSAEEMIWEKKWDFAGQPVTEVTIDENVTIPTEAEAGYYELKIKARDTNGNYSLSKIEVHIE